MRIMSASKHSGSIDKNMQFLQVLYQSVLLQTKRRSFITPEILLPCLCSLIWLCIVIILTPVLTVLTFLWFHNLLGHELVSGHQLPLYKGDISSSCLSVKPPVNTFSQPVYVPWHSNTLPIYQPQMIEKMWCPWTCWHCPAPSSRLLIKTLIRFYPSNLPSGLPL